MILVDSSAWIEYLRATESPTDHRLTGLLGEELEIAITDFVAMEVLAGARSPQNDHDLRRLLERAVPLPSRPFFDHEVAAQIYRTCRVAGDTPRKLADCLIAAVAIQRDLPILHNDRDFDLIARHTALQIA